MDIKFDRAKVMTDDVGAWLCLRVETPRIAREFIGGMKDAVYTVTPKQWRAKRSLDANAYLWVLCDKISKVLGIDKADVYKDAIVHQGVCDIIDIRRDALPEFVRHWVGHGIGWFAQKIDESDDRVTLAVYSGSSVYDSKQMSLIIDWIVQLAKDMDIETATPEEITLMKARWEDAQAD